MKTMIFKFVILRAGSRFAECRAECRKKEEGFGAGFFVETKNDEK